MNDRRKRKSCAIIRRKLKVKNLLKIQTFLWIGHSAPQC
jgi:hypothetical protein